MLAAELSEILLNFTVFLDFRRPFAVSSAGSVREEAFPSYQFSL